jgi:hypothetical protein
MALVQFGPAVGNMLGAIGTIAIQNSMAGPIARSMPAQLYSATDLQQYVRAASSALTKSWATKLTAAQRSAWGAFALAHPLLNRLSASFHLSGFMFYVMVNQRLTAAKQTKITDPPATWIAGSPYTISISWNPSIPQLTVNSTSPPGPNDVPIIWATKPLSLGIGKVKYKLRTIDVQAPGTAGPWDITLDYIAKFLTMPPGLATIISVKYTDSTSGAQGSAAQAQQQF